MATAQIFKTDEAPQRTTENTSPRKQSASNRHPGQTQTHSETDDAIVHELVQGRLVVNDLADHVLGHIVSTTMARDIFEKFVEQGFVRVHQNGATALLDPTSKDGAKAIKEAVEEAFDRARFYRCARSKARGGQSEDAPEGEQKKRKTRYSFKWETFSPTGDVLGEDDVVSFLNDVANRAFAFAEPKLAKTCKSQIRHRFAAPSDKNHAVPLSYAEADDEDMRPDFLLLPIAAFSNENKTVDQNYVNFTAARLVGESKNTNLAEGVAQMRRYARGIKRAQPWLYFVLGLAVTNAEVVFMRGDGSGTEQVELRLSDGWGCLEFIQIVLGLALADQDDLGHNPDVELEGKLATCKSQNVTWRLNSTAPRHPREIRITHAELRRARLQGVDAQLELGTISWASASTSTSSKRLHSEVADGSETAREAKKPKLSKPAVEYVERFVFVPIKVYGHKCLGILFTTSSIHGRGTTVFCVVDLRDGSHQDKDRLLALKMSWQDLAHAEDRDAVMKRLEESPCHPNVIVPIRTFKGERHGKTCTTLDAIRNFAEDHILDFGVENRVLTISESELKRPVQFFWGVHDFVRGLRGALLGHQYLVSIGILHRDISENNIVMGLRPEDERGYLIDFDMSILQDREEPSKSTTVPPRPWETMIPLPIDATKPAKALRTGTPPYMSKNVLSGGRHTHFDDVESFLYVLLLFFFSYEGPLSTSELEAAHKAGFVQSIGAGRPSHMRSWPKKYANWADGNVHEIADMKLAALINIPKKCGLTQDPVFLCCLQANWPAELHDPIRQLIYDSFVLFYFSLVATSHVRTEVSHEQFITILEDWLVAHADLEDAYSNCPFETKAA